MKEINSQNFLTKLTLILICLLLTGVIFFIGKSVIAPFFFALLLALLFLPFVNFMEEKLHFNRFFSTLSSFTLVCLLVFTLSSVFGMQLTSFNKDIPHLEGRFISLISRLQVWIDSSFHVNAEDQMAYLQQGLSKLLSSSGTIVGSVFTVFSSGLIFFFLSAIFFLFILLYRRNLSTFLVSVFQPKYRRKVKKVLEDIKVVSRKYVLGILLQAVIVGILTSSVLGLLNVKYALLLGTLTGILNVIPYIGIISSGTLALLFAFATATPITGLFVLIAYTVIHLIDSNIILPIIVGSIVKLNALAIFVGILVGAMLWGVVGMFLCIPTLAILRIVFKEIKELRAWGELLSED